jgi:hypothetical protein
MGATENLCDKPFMGLDYFDFGRHFNPCSRSAGSRRDITSFTALLISTFGLSQQ